MSKYLPGGHVAFYAVAKDHGRTVAASGPHDAPTAHRIADTPQFRNRAHGFAEFGVIKMHKTPGKAFPVFGDES